MPRPRINPQHTIDSPWYSRQDACKYLGISLATLDRWCRNGALTPYNVKGSDLVRLKRDELDALLTPFKYAPTPSATPPVPHRKNRVLQKPAGTP